MHQNDTPQPNHFFNQQRTAKVAVVLPVYNTARYLRECLDSILAQSYKNFVVFAVDDGSTDTSGQILNEYTAKDQRIVTFHKKNGGVSSARNVALDAIENEGSFDYIAFVDSDDLVKENFLELYVTHLSANCADYAVCGWEPFDKKGLLRGGRKLDHLPPKVIDRNGAFHHAYDTGDWDGIKSNAFSYFLSNRCFSTESIKGERFDVSMPKGEDQDFLIRALLHVKKGVVISDIVYMYRMRASSLSHDNSLCVDDMELVVALMKKAKFYPESARTGLERRALDCWWQAIKLAMSTGTYKKNKARFVEAYNCLKSFEYHSELPKKHQKRLRLFSLGDLFLKLYFSVRYNKNKDDELRNAFE